MQDVNVVLRKFNPTNTTFLFFAHFIHPYFLLLNKKTVETKPAHKNDVVNSVLSIKKQSLEPTARNLGIVRLQYPPFLSARK